MNMYAALRSHPLLRRVDWLPVWLVLPASALISAFMLYPIIRGVMLSFFNTRLLRYDQGRFIGAANYLDLLDDPYFWNSLGVTCLYALGSVAVTYVAGLLTALLLDREFPGR